MFPGGRSPASNRFGVCRGFMSPCDTMPTIMYYLGYLLPITYFLDILRGTILRGAGFAHLRPDAAAPVAFGAVILAVSALRFHNHIA